MKSACFSANAIEMQATELIQSPLNYTGGKYKLLPQLLPLFPGDIGLFVDLFCGGGNVGINVPCGKVIFNDSCEVIRYLFGTFRNLEKEETFRLIDSIIQKYGLSNSEEYGYEHYGCDSARGLAKYNSNGFNRLRSDFNKMRSKDYGYYITLFVLIVYSFNNQIRFNKSGEFNLPVGKRDFNKRMRLKLSSFIDRLKAACCEFESSDFRELSNESWDKDTFVYADPPYLITCASYNEQDGWNASLERALLSYLDGLDARGVRFALSNVLKSKGKENRILAEWASKNAARYRVICLDYSYANSSYHTLDRTSKADEVLIINY